MGNRYQKPTRPGSGARYSRSKSTPGMLWSKIRTRLGIGPGEEKSSFSIPDLSAGYQAQGSFEDDDDGRILRHQPGSEFNPMTGTYVMRQSDPPKRRKIWPWIVLAFAAIVFYYFAFDRNDQVKASPPDGSSVVGAMANTAGPTDDPWQSVAATDVPALTPTPSLPPIRTPAPSPTSAPAATSSALKYASKGEAVKNLQGQLIELGYMAPGTDDGAFGDVTQTAVLSFQKVNGLDADGIAGEKTLALIESGTAKEDPDVFVWVVNKGKVYHSDKDCSDMKDPKQIKKSKAEKQKLKPCDKCH